MKYLILCCLAIFSLERYYLLRRAEADNCLEGVGMLGMFLAAAAAVVGQVMVVWGP